MKILEKFIIITWVAWHLFIRLAAVFISWKIAEWIVNTWFTILIGY